MKHLMTQKFIFGLLIALVLAFGVQGVVEALTLTATSSVSQSARMGSTFEMSFRVGLNNPKDINDFNSNSRHIKAQVADRQYAAEERIRSNVAVSRTVDAGWTAGDTDYYTTSAVDTTTVVGLAITTTTRNWGISRSDDADLPAGKTWTSGDLTDRQYAAEERIRSNVAVSRTVDAGWTAGDTDYYTTSAVDTTTVVGLAITTTTRNWVTESNAFYYNDEAIEFWIERTGNPDGVTPAGTLKLKRPSYVLPGRSDDESGSTTTDVSTRSLQERVDIGLPSTISLVYEDATVGIHRIKVWDATPLVDFPPDAVPSNNRPRARTTFTLRVTPSSTDIAESDNIGPGNQRIPVQDAVVPVSAELTVTPTTGNHRIRYEIVKGSGSLYVGTLEEEYTRPSSTLSVHQGSNVYLKTNNSSNEVHVWFAGEDRTAPRATIVFEYRGQALPTTRTPTTTPTTPTPTPVSTTPSLTLSSTTISGAAGSSQTVTATVQRGTSLAPGIAVTFQVGSLTPVVLSTNTSGQVSHTFTLPSADTTLTVSANVLGTPVSASATLDVTGTTDTTDTTDDTTPVQVPTDI
ncbi:MAG: hypothetical protein OXN25_15450, partial [Candidatus Poribacteria bacterium]|nr:hypothetical protein [Candidatus Poribacteria bacterium]